MRGAGVVCKTPTGLVRSRSQHCAGRRVLQTALRVSGVHLAPTRKLLRCRRDAGVTLETANVRTHRLVWGKSSAVAKRMRLISIGLSASRPETLILTLNRNTKP